MQAIHDVKIAASRLLPLSRLVSVRTRAGLNGGGENAAPSAACEDLLEKLVVVIDGRELRKLAHDIIGRVEKETVVGLREHRRVVERITGGDDVVVERLERGDGVPFLVRQAELVARDAVIFHDEAMAKKCGSAELLHERIGKLLERIGEEDNLNAAAEFVEKFAGTGKWREAADHLLDSRERDAVSVENGDAGEHEFVVVRLVARGAAQFGEAGAFGDGDPNFRREDAFHVEGDDALLHR